MRIIDICILGLGASLCSKAPVPRSSQPAASSPKITQQPAVKSQQAASIPQSQAKPVLKNPTSSAKPTTQTTQTPNQAVKPASALSLKESNLMILFEMTYHDAHTTLIKFCASAESSLVWMEKYMMQKKRDPNGDADRGWYIPCPSIALKAATNYAVDKLSHFAEVLRIVKNDKTNPSVDSKRAVSLWKSTFQTLQTDSQKQLDKYKFEPKSYNYHSIDFGAIRDLRTSFRKEVENLEDLRDEYDRNVAAVLYHFTKLYAILSSEEILATLFSKLAALFVYYKLHSQIFAKDLKEARDQLKTDGDRKKRSDRKKRGDRKERAFFAKSSSTSSSSGGDQKDRRSFRQISSSTSSSTSSSSFLDTFEYSS